MSIGGAFTATSVVAGVIAVQACAQSSDWSAVGELKPGSRVAITLKDGRRVEGRMSGWSAGNLQMKSRKGIRTISMQDVRRVYAYNKISRWRGALIGTLVGFGIGFAVGASSAGYITDRNSPSASWRAAVGSGVGIYGAAIGAPVGALAGGSKVTAIYRSEAKP
jgi:hypothetical protein